MSITWLNYDIQSEIASYLHGYMVLTAVQNARRLLQNVNFNASGGCLYFFRPDNWDEERWQSNQDVQLIVRVLSSLTRVRRLYGPCTTSWDRVFDFRPDMLKLLAACRVAGSSARRFLSSPYLEDDPWVQMDVSDIVIHGNPCNPFNPLEYWVDTGSHRPYNNFIHGNPYKINVCMEHDIAKTIVQRNLYMWKSLHEGLLDIFIEYERARSYIEPMANGELLQRIDRKRGRE